MNDRDPTPDENALPTGIRGVWRSADATGSCTVCKDWGDSTEDAPRVFEVMVGVDGMRLCAPCLGNLGDCVRRAGDMMAEKSRQRDLANAIVDSLQRLECFDDVIDVYHDGDELDVVIDAITTVLAAHPTRLA